MGHSPTHPLHQPLDESHPRRRRPPLSPTLRSSRRAARRRDGRWNRRRPALHGGTRRGNPSNPSTSTPTNQPGHAQLEREKWVLQSTYLKQWQLSGIDGLILPVLPWVGYRPKTWVLSKQWLGYTALFNLLNYAAVTVPVAAADEVLDRPDDSWRAHVPRNASDEFNHRQCEFSSVPLRG